MSSTILQKTLFVCCLLLGGTSPILAQENAIDSTENAPQTPKKHAKPLRIGLGMFGTNYVGDLTEGFSALNRFYPGGAISFQMEGKSHFKGQVNTGLGTYSEQLVYSPVVSDNPKVKPNNFVYAPFFFVDGKLNYHFFKKKLLHPYIGTGAGIMTFAPADQEENSLFEAPKTRPKGEEYPTFTFYIPATFGFQWQMNHYLGLGLDYTYRKVFTDYLDNVGILGTRKGPDYLHSLQVSMYITPNPEHKDVQFYRPRPAKPVTPDSILAQIELKEEVKKLRKRVRDVDSLLVETDGSLDDLNLNARNELIKVRKIKINPDEVGSLADLDDGNLSKGYDFEHPEEAGIDIVTDDSVFKEIIDRSALPLFYEKRNQERERETLPNPTETELAILPSESPNLSNLSTDICTDMWVCLELKEWRERNFHYYECKPGDTYDYICNRFKIRKSTLLTLNPRAKKDAPPSDGVLWMPDVRYWISLMPDEDKIRKESGIGGKR